MSAQPDVRVGQIWRDNDKRMTSRPWLRVIAVDDQYVTLQETMRGREGRTVRILKRRMRPNSTGFALVRDA